jgi:hypothetical protein
MAKTSKITQALLGTAFALGAMAHANDAMALDAGQCGPRADMEAALRAEGQFPIVSGFRSIPSRPRNLFTSNTDRSLGYNIEGDQTQLCVRAKYTDIRLNTNPDFARPSWAYIAPANSPFNAFMSAQESRINLRVIFGATALVKGQDGIERRGALLTVSKGNGDEFVTNRGTMVAANTGNGQYQPIFGLEDIVVNQRNFQQLASATQRPVLVASNQSPR